MRELTNEVEELQFSVKKVCTVGGVYFAGSDDQCVLPVWTEYGWHLCLFVCVVCTVRMCDRAGRM